MPDFLNLRGKLNTHINNDISYNENDDKERSYYYVILAIIFLHLNPTTC